MKNVESPEFASQIVISDNFTDQKRNFHSSPLINVFINVFNISGLEISCKMLAFLRTIIVQSFIVIGFVVPEIFKFL